QGAFSVGVVGDETSPLAQGVTAELDQTEAFDVTRGNRADELAALDSGDRTVVVIFTEGATAGQAQAELFYDQSDPQRGAIALNSVQQFLNQVNVDALGEQRPMMVSVEAV